MPAAAPRGSQPIRSGLPGKSSQGVRVFGSRASFLGGAQTSTMRDATQGADDRWTRVRDQRSWELSETVIGACIEVHRVLGPGLLESIYEEALSAELQLRDLPFERQQALPVVYKGRALSQVYRADLIVGGQLLVEVKSVESILFVHVAQAVTYLRVTGLEHGLVVNFNSVLMRDGLRRVSRTPYPSQGSRSSDLPVKTLGTPRFGPSSCQDSSPPRPPRKQS
jgi:GxxExxY protein